MTPNDDMTLSLVFFYLSCLAMSSLILRLIYDAVKRRQYRKLEERRVINKIRSAEFLKEYHAKKAEVINNLLKLIEENQQKAQEGK